MSRVIKLKQQDIENIVKTILEEEQPTEFDDFDTKIQPEELPGANDEELTLGQDKEGNFYVFINADEPNPDIVLKTD
jgi:hypothetical protein